METPSHSRGYGCGGVYTCVVCGTDRCHGCDKGLVSHIDVYYGKVWKCLACAEKQLDEIQKKRGSNETINEAGMSSSSPVETSCSIM
jgi:hypothetical protein